MRQRSRTERWTRDTGGRGIIIVARLDSTCDHQLVHPVREHSTRCWFEWNPRVVPRATARYYALIEIRCGGDWYADGTAIAAVGADDHGRDWVGNR